MIKYVITCFYRIKTMAKLMATALPQYAVRTDVFHLAASGGIMTTCYSESHNTVFTLRFLCLYFHLLVINTSLFL